MSMRVTDRYQQHQTLARLREQQTQLQRAQDRVTSGLKIQTMSDDPVASSVLMRVNGALRDIDQYQRNGTEATTRLGTEDGALTSVIKLLDQAHTLAMDGASQATDAATRQGLAQQVKQIFDQVVALGNTTFGGEHIFAGGKTDQPAFAADGSYAGDSTVRQVQLDSGEVMNVSHPGDQVFGAALAALNGLMQQLQSGTGGSTAASVDALSAARAGVQQVQNDTASRVAEVRASATALAHKGSVLQDQRDNLQVADPTESSIALVSLQNSIERAYAAIGKVLSTHLTDFLK
jgi:flagellar hook-associated protein 3 FlgL